MNAASISATKQFGFGLNVLVQNLREKSVGIGQGNIRTGNGTWMNLHTPNNLIYISLEMYAKRCTTERITV